MNALDSPLEALALNYLRYGFLTTINNIWAWIAVVTAAVSVWRFRALSSPPPQNRLRFVQDDAASISSEAQPKVLPATISNSSGHERTEAKPLSAPTTTVTSSRVLESWECYTKTKFSLYYKLEDCHLREDDDGGESEGDGGGEVVVTEKLQGGWGDNDWERMMVVRMGDLGWYRCQDRAVLNGSVVRLWDAWAEEEETRGGVGGGRRRPVM